MYAQLKRHLLKDVDFNPEEIQAFTNLLSHLKLNKKAVLIQPGDKVTKEYYVLKGCLKAYYIDEAGQDHIIQFAIEDWWISDFEAFFNAKPAQLYVECLEETELLSLNKLDLEQLYQTMPKFERFFRLKVTKAFVALRNRVLSGLQNDNKARYEEFCEQYPDLEKRIPNYNIANYLGMSPESLSRIRNSI